MKNEIKVPSVGESITTGVVVSWLKHNGEQIQEGDILFELETDKAVLEIPSPGAGTLEILVKEGTEVSIGQTVGMLGQDAAKSQPSASTAEETSTAVDKKSDTPVIPPANTQAVTEQKPEPKTIQDTEAKPHKAASSPMPWVVAPKKQVAGERRTERVPMSTIRKKIAERLVQAKQNTAYLTTFNEIDMQKVINIRTQYKDQFLKKHGIKIGFMSFFVKACCQALKDFPSVNTQLEGDDIIYKYFYDIGVAMSIDKGLIVPVIRDADTRHFAEIETAIASMAQRAKEKKLMPDELAGGTFTITNGGIFGSLLSTPIPAYPQTAILGMHAIKKRPVVIDDQIIVRPMMYVALTYDHRVIDGREAVSFLAKVKEFIENPDRLLLVL
ncbi:MAG: 2-oxoglutarate dehydrogenase complex dihydrolipoyllysine-residue succinyltransferase [Planctomycetes bacterium]|nr:2-oxoglutarate dehydrogenase complex dihydrolipoyllysine-residue succinyltransferase [Planctomycetota bacterium]